MPLAIFFYALPPVGTALVLALLVISLSLHEVAHGWVALKCGDRTAHDLGRLSLNPLVHVDPFMTIVLPLVLYLTTGFIFGGAKPVPVNFHNLRRPYRDMALVALAGPATNFLLAMVLIAAYRVSIEFGPWQPGMLGPKVLSNGILFNLLLAAFNLIPIPPLDGSRIMAWLLPAEMRPAYHRLETFGLLLVFLLIFAVPGFQTFLSDTLNLLLRAAEFGVSLGGLW